MNGLAIGRIVHFVTGDRTCRPSLVTRVVDEEAGTVNLTVFSDGVTDSSLGGAGAVPPLVQVAGVTFDANPGGVRNSRTWHFPSVK